MSYHPAPDNQAPEPLTDRINRTFIQLWHRLPRNPVVLVGRLERGWLFTYHTPAKVAAKFLPAGLELITHADEALWNVSVCNIVGMRPRSFARALAVSYWHIAYNLYVRFRPPNRGVIEGLYCVRNECDNYLVAVAGTLFAGELFYPTPSIQIAEKGDAVKIYVGSADASAYALVAGHKRAELPEYSLFKTVEEAQNVFKFKPTEISLAPSGGVNVVQIKRDERAWRAQPVHSDEVRFAFLEELRAQGEICLELASIDCQWGRAENYPLPG